MPNTEHGRVADYDRLAEQILPKWREEFLSFVTRGVASDAFLEFLDHDEATQKAVEEAFADEVRKFNDFAASLNIDQDVIEAYVRSGKRTPQQRRAVPRILSDVLDYLVHQTRPDRDTALDDVVASCGASRTDVLHVVEELRRKLEANRETQPRIGLDRGR